MLERESLLVPCSFQSARPLILAIAFGFTQPAQASPIRPGFDFFTSNDAFGNSLGASVDLGVFGLGIIGLVYAPRPWLIPLENKKSRREKG